MRVVSLVPSITETLVACGVDSRELVGRTDWCVRPLELLEEIPACGGTKNPRLARVLELQPDLVLMDAEENRREDCEALRAAGLEVHAFHVCSVREASACVRTLGGLVGRVREAEDLALDIETSLGEVATAVAQGPRPRLIPLVWHQPLMSVAPTRYTGDLLVCAGFEVLSKGDAGYPRWTLHELAAARPDVLLLSEEPHDFTVEEAADLRAALGARGLSSTRVVKWEAGHELTWFGVSTREALRHFAELRAQCALPSRPC